MKSASRRESGSRGGGRRVVMACVLAATAAASTRGADLVDPLTVRLNDPRGVPGGEVTITLRTYRSRAVKQGRITVTTSTGTQRSIAPGSFGAVAAEPFVGCDEAIVFSASADAAVSGQVFDATSQSVELDFESPTSSVNATDGVLAAIVCTLSETVQDGERYELDLSLAPGDSAWLDPGSTPILLAPRVGQLRIDAALAPELAVDDAEVKPGATALVEIATGWAFAIESGTVDVGIDPAIVRDPPTVVAMPRHGAIEVVSTDWNPTTGRFQFSFVSADASFNETIPGTLFQVLVPTVVDPALVGNSFEIGLSGGATALEGPGGLALTPLSLEPGTLLFSDDPKVEDVFRDGFGAATFGWSLSVGVTSD